MLPGNAAGSVRPAEGPSRLWRTTAASATGKLLLLLLSEKLLACPWTWLGRPAPATLESPRARCGDFPASGCRCILRMDHHCPWVSYSIALSSPLRACMQVSHITPFNHSACMRLPHVTPCAADELLHRLPQLPLLHSVYLLRLPGISLCSA